MKLGLFGVALAIGGCGAPAPAAAGPDGADPSCNDPGQEPNDSETWAVPLAAIDDCDGSGSSVGAMASGPADADFFSFRGSDSILCSVNPTAAIGEPDVRLCLFVACAAGTTTLNACTNGTQSVSAAGLPGCCAPGPATVEADFNCSGLEEVADVFLRVDQAPAGACLPYRIDYHY